jgi:hypothetical protein
MTIGDAAKELLQIRKQPLGNSEIYERLRAGGLAFQTATLLNTVGSVLTRRFSDVGDIVCSGPGTWGLAEWYPNRNFRKKAED